MELFGRRPRPNEPASKTNLPEPFHVYSMRQAIEEGFILDVLQNYTSYKVAFRLAHEGKEIDDREVERSAAKKAVMGWVRLHPYNISRKVETVVEHYRQHVHAPEEVAVDRGIAKATDRSPRPRSCRALAAALL